MTLALTRPMDRPVDTVSLPRLRDNRLDFWRALCLIDMVLVHLVYNGVNFGAIQRAVGEYTRFAAGGFVFIAGLSVGAIFLPRTKKPGGQKKVYASLLRRSLYILCVHFVASFSFVCLDLMRGMRDDLPSIGKLISNVLLFREGGDLLPLYVIVIAFSPVALELLRRGLWWVLAMISVAGFAWGSINPWVLSSPSHENFPVLLWQLMFVFGLLAGSALPWYTARSTRTKKIFALSAIAISLFLWAADFRSELGWAWPVLPFGFTKTPLNVGEALRYFGLILAILCTTDLLWAKIGQSRAVTELCTIGRRSLMVYVVHVWIVGLLASLAWKIPSWGAWQMLLTTPALVSLWGIAKLWDWYEGWIEAARTSFGWASKWLPIPAGALASLIAFAVASVSVQPPPPSNIMATKLQEDWQASIPEWPDSFDIGSPDSHLEIEAPDTAPIDGMDPSDIISA